MSLAAVKKVSAEDRKTLLRKGITVVDVPQSMIDELAKVAATVQNELVGKVYSKEELDMVIAHRDEYRAKHKAAAK